ncbi:MAG: hypothetical protein EA397_18175 [Deltaproteobacteria bacterium]|nr:MAG: hypothetical protein EA397_18175 [Deltaproteobacteria bacterium]
MRAQSHLVALGRWVERFGLARLVGLAVLTFLGAALQLLLVHWVVEDAAISVAYARHLAMGEGLVPYLGGERVEGYSNPLWVGVLSASAWLGLDGLAAAKVLGMACGAAAIPATWWLVREVGSQERDQSALFAAALLAVSAPHTIWSASGMESGLFSLLLAVGAALTLREARLGGRPYSALIWLGLALTRPEGLAYVVPAALASVVGVRGGGRRALWWAGLFGGPFASYQVLRWWYFAFELPNTFYAKATNPAKFAGAQPFNGRGWRYLGAYLSEPASVIQAPLLAIGLGRRTRGLLLCFGLILVGVSFSVVSGGDWMRGHRFMANFAVPQAVLAGSGLAWIARGIRRWAPATEWVVGAMGVGAVALASILDLGGFARDPETTPFEIRQRVAYYERVADRLGLEERPVVLDVDMGGNMLFGQAELVDVAGLVDVAFGIRWFEELFVHEVVLHERRPHLAHVHGPWGRVFGLSEQPVWKDHYVELPPYLTLSKAWHPGTFLRRDLLAREDPSAPSLADFEGDLSLVRFEVPWRQVAAGRSLPLELAWRSGPTSEGFRVSIWLDGPERAPWSHEVLPAHGWLAATDWREHEVVFARHELPLAEDLPPGRYRLGLVVLDDEGPRRPVRWRGGLEVPGAETLAVTSKSELRAPFEIEILSPELFDHQLDALRERWERAVRSGRCERAEEVIRTTWRRAGHKAWRAEVRQPVAQRMADCWLSRASEGGEAEEEALVLAERWRPGSARVPGRPRVEALMAEGRRALADGDGSVAYDRFRRVLQIDPHRAWARRFAEQARDCRLGLSPTPGGPIPWSRSCAVAQAPSTPAPAYPQRSPGR